MMIVTNARFFMILTIKCDAPSSKSSPSCSEDDNGGSETTQQQQKSSLKQMKNSQGEKYTFVTFWYNDKGLLICGCAFHSVCLL